jgi:hypothetical protein
MTRYGASRLHLVVHVATLVLAGWALAQVLQIRRWEYVLAWLAGAVVLHDLVLLPAYTALDRLVPRRRWTNHVRVPLGIAALLLLVFFPVVCGRGERNYARVSGREWDGYALRWLAATAALLAVSALVYGIRSRSRS